MIGRFRIVLIALGLLIILGLAATFIAPSWFAGSHSSEDERVPATAEPATAVRKVTLDVTGMHCSGCVVMITQALEKTPGVVSAKVSLEDERAEIALSTNDDITPALLAAVEEAGYQAQVAE